MTLETLVVYMNQGREIEFSLGEKDYFLQPDYDAISNAQIDSTVQYVLYEIDILSSASIIGEGCIDELLKFDFGNGMSFMTSFECFNIKYVL